MIELDPDARALIRAARGGDDATPSERDEVLARFHARRHELEGSETAPSSQFRRQRARRAGPHRLVPWAVAAVVFTGSIGAFANWGAVRSRMAVVLVELREAIAPTPPAPVEPTSRRNAHATPTPPAAALPPVPPVPEEGRGAELDPPVRHEEASTMPAPARAARPHPKAAFASAPAAPAAAQRHEPIGAELALISEARDALGRGDYTVARSSAQRHGREFPRGELALERQTILALAACRETGDTRLAQQLVARHPSSLFVPRIVRDCKLTSNSVPATASTATYPSSADESPGAERKP